MPRAVLSQRRQLRQVAQLSFAVERDVAGAVDAALTPDEITGIDGVTATPLPGGGVELSADPDTAGGMSRRELEWIV